MGTKGSLLDYKLYVTTIELFAGILVGQTKNPRTMLAKNIRTMTLTPSACPAISYMTFT